MKDISFLPDDPKLTAYALGELTGDERAAVEAALRHDPRLRAAVDEIRAIAAQLEAALVDEAILPAATDRMTPLGNHLSLIGHSIGGSTPTPPPRLRRRVTAASAKDPRRSHDGIYSPRSWRRKLLHFPQFYYVAGGVAAAGFALLVVLRDPKPTSVTQAPSPLPVYREVALAPPLVREAPAVAADTTASQLDMSVRSATDSTLKPVITLPPQDLSVSGTIRSTLERPAAASTAVTESGPSLDRQPSPERASLAAAGNREPDSVVRPTSTPELPSRVALRPVAHDAAIGPNLVPSAGAVPAQDPQGVGAAPDAATGGAAGGDTAAALASSTANPPARTITFQAPAPIVANSALALTSSGSLIPGSINLLPTSPITAVPGSGETVMLSAFMVAADRASGFAVLSDAQNSPRGARNFSERAHLPHPPPGAKFSRNADTYAYVRDNDFLSVRHNPLSTFSIDVDTASYANVRRIIQQGSPPPRDAVRIEELLNYFPYHYAAPKGDVPFAASLEVADAPWAPTHRLVRIGLKAREVANVQRPSANLVFLLDVSSSMNQPNKLPLVKESLRLLIGKLRADDRVAIVTYAGNSGLALASTPVARSREILNALDALTPLGSANGAMGIQLAYQVAEANFAKNGVNRIILCTDGDFDVGITSEGDLLRLVERKAGSGVYLTVLGFGMGNYKDATLEKLADLGNGNHGYIDTRREAEKLLVEEISTTLVTVAKDVKVQVEFNPARVSSYRLIGYENRLLRKEDFNLDKTDAGEIGAGQSVTALYEIVPVGIEDGTNASSVDVLKYGTPETANSRLQMPISKRDPLLRELLTVKVRFKKPNSFISWPRSLEFPLVDATTPFAKASADFRFAAAVAQFGMILRDSPYRGTATMSDVTAWASSAAAPQDDSGGYREEFIELVRKTQVMME
jgi:secreted protein with Ig-like and vWFA domain